MAAEQPVLAGSARRPFPVIMPLDYPACRCRAWLDALKNSHAYLPANVRQRFLQLNLEAQTGMDALCALLFPVDVVTPEISAAPDIKVYLKFAGKIRERSKEILDSPLDLVLMMALIREMKALLQNLNKSWPEKLVPEVLDLPKLEKLSLRLSALWLLVPGVEKNVRQAAVLDPDSLVASLMFLEQELADKRFESINDKLDDMEKFLPDALRHEDGVNLSLAAYALMIRGEAHLQQGMLALAERDFSEALKKLQNPVSVPDLAGRLFIARASLAMRKRNWNGMCADLENACSYGVCNPLIEARLRGLCPREKE